MGNVDHVIIAVRDLETAAQRWRDTVGITFQHGGLHPGGTENCLGVFSGQELYLELIAVRDPASTDPFTRLARAHEGPLTWAIGTDDLDRDAALLTDAGLAVGPIRDGSRRCPDGTWVTWRSAIIGPPGTTSWPFLIEWPLPVGARLGVAATVTGLQVTGMTVGVPDPRAAVRVLTSILGFTRACGDERAVTDGVVTVMFTECDARHPGPVRLVLSGQCRGSFELDGLTVSIEPERMTERRA